MGKVTGTDNLNTSEVEQFASANDPVLRAKVQGDAFERIRIEADGTIVIGNGTVAPTTDATSGVSLPLAGGTLTGLLTATQGVSIAGPGNAAQINGYTPLVDLLPADSDPSDVAMLVKIPGPSWGVSQRYGEGNALVFANDGDNFVATPTPILASITATTNATPVAITLSTATCATAADPTGVDNTHFHSGDLVRITGTGIAALDNRWWKITVTSTTSFTLNTSVAPGSTSAAGYAFSDRGTPISRIADTGLGTMSGHFAPGLRGRTGITALPTQGVWIQNHVDCVGLVINNAAANVWGPAPTADYLMVTDTRAASAKRFAVNAAGQTIFDNGTVGAPGLAFVADPTTGLYATVPGLIAFSISGVLRGFLSATVFNLAVPIAIGAGTSSIADAANLAIGTTTGSKIGTATNQKVAFHNATPVIQRAGAAQTAAASTASTQTTPWGFSTQAQADAIVTLVNELRAALVEKGLIKGSA